MVTKNFSEEQLSQLLPTSGLACRLQEAKAITQVLKEKITSFPKDRDSKSIQFTMLDNVHNTKHNTSKTTGRANQQEIQSTNTNEKIKKRA